MWEEAGAGGRAGGGCIQQALQLKQLADLFRHSDNQLGV